MKNSRNGAGISGVSEFHSDGGLLNAEGCYRPDRAVSRCLASMITA